MQKLRIIAGSIGLAATLSLVTSTSVFAEPPDMTSGFVCPVLGGQAGTHGSSDRIVLIGEGDYSVLGPDITVPVHATNGDGSGTPGSHQSPGEENYSPIWAGISGPPGPP